MLDRAMVLQKLTDLDELIHEAFMRSEDDWESELLLKARQIVADLETHITDEV